MILLSAIFAVAKLMGFLREQLLASYFGASAVMDAYVSAQVLPSLLDTIVGGAIAAVVVPLFTSARASGSDKVARAFHSALVVFGVVYVAESALLCIGAPWALRLLVPGLPPTALGQGIQLARLFSGMTATLGLSSLFGALLNVHGHFLWPGLTVVSANVTVLAAALIYRQHVTMEHLTWAVVLGSGIQLTLLAWRASRVRLPWHGISLDWVLIRSIWVTSLPLILANSIGQLHPVFDTFLASQMREGSIAALSYAGKIILLPVGVLVMGLSSVLLARFSHMVVHEARDSLATEVGRTFRTLASILLPVSALTIILAEPAVRVAFGRGHFGESSVLATSAALKFYGAGLMGMTCLPILSQAMVSLNNTRAALVSGVCSTVVYAGGALLLGPLMGHRGLALAFAIGQSVGLVIIVVALARELGDLPMRMLLASLPVTATATLVALAVGWGARAVLPGAFAQLLAGTLTGGVVYLTIHVWCRTEEAAFFLHVLKRTSLFQRWGGATNADQRAP